MSNRILTDQMVFDITAEHLVTQGVPALNGRLCMYRTEDGLRCAVGVHFTDEEYDISLEGKDVNALYEVGVLPKRLVPHLALLVDLQAAHDTELFAQVIIHDLRAIAQARGLSASILDEASCGR